MKKSLIKKTSILLMSIFSITGIAKAQTKAKPVLWDGMIVSGYVDKGAYVNFGGPCIKLVKKPVAVTLGMLPSLRIKEDKVVSGAKKNSILTPMLGFGAAVIYKHLVVQVPLYYVAKTAAADGSWKIGVGVGYKF
ncbi:hypothetical protein ACQ33O_12435 [Ferruginibacter sp. SUN002]|uniref:hypothetical protein n=1 Tax=Ferruginibacter sp. SUN002 TaxID=2937789 RepID=UPI003D35F7FC